MAQCGYCGDILPFDQYRHDCWLAKHMQAQDSLESPPQEAFLEIGDCPEDAKMSSRMKQVDISNL